MNRSTHDLGSTATSADIGGGDWRNRAICRDEDPERFFPVGRADSHTTLIQEEAAKAVCRSCPVQEACLVWALDALEYGVAGGMSENERRVERRRRGARVLSPGGGR